MKKRAEPIRSLIASGQDAEALRDAAERIGWNLFVFDDDTEAAN